MTTASPPLDGPAVLALLLSGDDSRVPQDALDALSAPWDALALTVLRAGDAGRLGAFRTALSGASDADALYQSVMAIDPRAPGWRPDATGAAWPQPLGRDAFHGLAGSYVQLIAPHTEADQAAILGQFLAAFGSVIGRTAYWTAEAHEHYGNLFLVLVGPSSKGRKGSSWSQVRRVFASVDERWATTRVVSGLSSGEGLIAAVRDALPGAEAADKRLLVIQEEFASVLKVSQRAGNTLSPVLRSAFDTGSLQTLTRADPLRAHGAHVSLVGHITIDELRRLLDGTEAGNGFGNRFLWIGARRSQFLPDGGSLSTVNLGPTINAVRDAVEFAATQGLVQRDREATTLWNSRYQALSTGRPGMAGALTSRAEVQVMRLAMLYALLDHTAQIGRAHLAAALEFWRYTEETVRHVFGEDTGDRLTDAILGHLRDAPEGLTKSELTRKLSNNQAGGSITTRLASLREHGLVNVRLERTGGRPAERYLYIDSP